MWGCSTIQRVNSCNDQLVSQSNYARTKNSHKERSPSEGKGANGAGGINLVPILKGIKRVNARDKKHPLVIEPKSTKQGVQNVLEVLQGKNGDENWKGNVKPQQLGEIAQVGLVVEREMKEIKNKTPMKRAGKYLRGIVEETEMIKHLTQKLRKREGIVNTSPRNAGAGEGQRGKIAVEKKGKQKKGPISMAMFSF